MTDLVKDDRKVIASLFHLAPRREEMQAHMAVQSLSEVAIPAAEVLALVEVVEATRDLRDVTAEIEKWRNEKANGLPYYDNLAALTPGTEDYYVRMNEIIEAFWEPLTARKNDAQARIDAGLGKFTC